jgi:hypothetical protein
MKLISQQVQQNTKFGDPRFREERLELGPLIITHRDCKTITGKRAEGDLWPCAMVDEVLGSKHIATCSSGSG